jgi:hypothetical protein
MQLPAAIHRSVSDCCNTDVTRLQGELASKEEQVSKLAADNQRCTLTSNAHRMCIEYDVSLMHAPLKTDTMCLRRYLLSCAGYESGCSCWRTTSAGWERM